MLCKTSTGEIHAFVSTRCLKVFASCFNSGWASADWEPNLRARDHRPFVGQALSAANRSREPVSKARAS